MRSLLSQCRLFPIALAAAAAACWASSTPPVRAADSPKPAEQTALELVGVVDLKGETRALIAGAGLEGIALVAVGDLIQGFTLSQIRSGEIELSRGEETRTVVMKDRKRLVADLTIKTYTHVYSGPNSFHPIRDVKGVPSQFGERSASQAATRTYGRRGAPRFIRPLRGGYVSSGFGRRLRPWTRNGWGSGEHLGVDIAAPHGTRVHAAASGIVAQAVRSRSDDRGRHVVIRHGGGYETHYYHLSQIFVEVGNTVRQNQVIGTEGNTGTSTGPHLHFGIFKNGDPLDPALFVRSLRR